MYYGAVPIFWRVCVVSKFISVIIPSRSYLLHIGESPRSGTEETEIVILFSTKMGTQLVLKHDVARFTIHESNLACKNSGFARKVVAESRANNCSQPVTTRFVARQV